ncbi:efflux RND transporter periplasmic adaptor subunit [Eisenbergiella tayi]
MKKNYRMKSLAVLLTAALALGGCQGSTDEAETETADTSLAVEAAVPEVGDLSVSSTFIGTISPQEQVSIIPLVSGEVSSVHFQVGDQVQAGDVLLQIDDEAARLQLESARLTKEGAELSAQRTLGSSQVMSNLSMESNIKNIQYQIDMAKKQYDTAGNSIADTQQKKEDMKSALDKINDSIKDMESGYSNMKNMARTAKQYVYQDANGVWRWITDPEPNWGEEYETTPSTGTQPSETPSSGDSSTGSTTPGSDADSLNNNGGMTVPDSSSSGNGGTNSSGQNSSEEAPEEEEKEESGSQEEGKSEGTGQNSAKDEESKSSTAESPAVQESPSVPESPSGNEPKAQGVAFYTGKGFSIGKSGRYGKPAGEPTAMQAVAGTGMTEEIRIIQIDNTDGKGTYEEFLKAKAKYEMDLAVVSQFKSAGYTAADVREGRLDSSVANFATQIASMKSQASTLDGNISSIDSSIDSAETSRSTTGDTIDFYEENLKDAQVQYGIQNGQAYQDTAAALQNQIASSEVGIKSAEMQLENYTLTSPISGVIEQKNVDEFGMVSAGNPVYVISNKDSLTVTFYVSEAVKNQLVTGEKITLERSGETFDAAITQIGQSVDARTGLFEIKAATENTALSNGVTVKITADTYRASSAMLLPYDAVYYEGEQAYVFCAEDGIARKTLVETGLYNDDKIEILSGLSADSIVIHTWSSQLTDGAKVRLVEGEAGK